MHVIFPRQHKKNKSISGGFSLVEVLIAVFLLSVGIVAVVGLIAGSLRHTIEARDTVIGAQLAQEGVELVRYVRDNNIAKALNGSIASDEVLTKDFPSTTRNCHMDKNATTPTCPASNFRLSLSSSTGNYYVHGGGSLTKFHRRITIAPGGSGSQLTVTSMVKWHNGSFPNVSNAVAECTVAKKCSFSSVMLTDWKKIE